MTEKGMLQAIGSVLECKDVKTLVVALEGINFILKSGKEHLTNENGQNPLILIADQCGLIDKLEQLQMSKNQKVYEKAVQILETYFTLEDEQDIMEMLPPSGTMHPLPESSSLWGNASSTTSQSTFSF